MDLIRQKDFPANYSQSVLRILGVLSMTDMKGMRMLGSSSIRSQQYAGDYDANEIVKSSSIESVAAKLQDIVRGVRVEKLMYITEIKCGEISEWNVFREDAMVVNGKIQGFNRNESQKRVEELRQDNILTQKEADESIALLEKATTPMAFLEARKTIRHHILRWKPADILEGAMVYRDKVIKLEDAIKSGGVIKIDTIAEIQNRFVEVSVVYEISIKGKKIAKNSPPILLSLQEDIAFYSKTNPFKALKRTFALAKLYKNTKALTLLVPLLNSDLGRLYQIIGDIGTLVELLRRPSVPLQPIRENIDEFRARLGTIYGLKDVLQQEHTILGDLYSILKLTDKSKMMMRLEELKDTLQGNLNRETMKQIKAVSKIALK